MAHDKATSPLMNLPLEVRHTIFEYAAVRNTKPKKLLRYWFEKKEVTELVAKEVADNPTGPTPSVVYHQEHEIDSETPEEDDQHDQHEDDEDNADEGEDDEVEQEQEDQEADDGAEEDEDEEAMEDDQHTQAQSTSQTPTSAQGASLSAQTQTTTQTLTQLAGAGGEVDEENAEVDIQDAETATEDPQHVGGGEVMAAEEGEEGENDEGGDEEGDENNAEEAHHADEDGNTHGTAIAPQQPPPPPAPVVSPARKWRHIPNFMRITHCPPPVELLLASKQLNEEAKNWFYDVAVLRINATGSFAHTSFFEEAFRQITDAAFSPMENVRKVAVLFAWDTTWLRADDTGCAEAIFPALLRQRSDFVYQILSQAPDLKEVTIHWHDSAQDNESANFMLDILAPFHSLNVHLAIKEHYIAADAKPHKRSIAGQRRVEFQSIVDAGLDRLF